MTEARELALDILFTLGDDSRGLSFGAHGTVACRGVVRKAPPQPSPSCSPDSDEQTAVSDSSRGSDSEASGKTPSSRGNGGRFVPQLARLADCLRVLQEGHLRLQQGSHKVYLPNSMGIEDAPVASSTDDTAADGAAPDGQGHVATLRETKRAVKGAAGPSTSTTSSSPDSSGSITAFCEWIEVQEDSLGPFVQLQLAKVPVVSSQRSGGDAEMAREGSAGRKGAKSRRQGAVEEDATHTGAYGVKRVAGEDMSSAPLAPSQPSGQSLCVDTAPAVIEQIRNNRVPSSPAKLRKPAVSDALSPQSRQADDETHSHGAAADAHHEGKLDEKVAKRCSTLGDWRQRLAAVAQYRATHTMRITEVCKMVNWSQTRYSDANKYLKEAEECISNVNLDYQHRLKLLQLLESDSTLISEFKKFVDKLTQEAPPDPRFPSAIRKRARSRGGQRSAPHSPPPQAPHPPASDHVDAATAASAAAPTAADPSAMHMGGMHGYHGGYVPYPHPAHSAAAGGMDGSFGGYYGYGGAMGGGGYECAGAGSGGGGWYGQPSVGGYRPHHLPHSHAGYGRPGPYQMPYHSDGMYTYGTVGPHYGVVPSPYGGYPPSLPPYLPPSNPSQPPFDFSNTLSPYYTRRDTHQPSHQAPEPSASPSPSPPMWLADGAADAADGAGDDVGDAANGAGVKEESESGGGGGSSGDAANGNVSTQEGEGASVYATGSGSGSGSGNGGGVNGSIASVCGEA
ncbi:unnamed protein product [Vitrella brassicaformis CCMP3155]|uniref:Uncharacterized protein n=2 Tax=Vitrella brassicaformis TaxID=1169539 RepID=A0A0G4GPK0_VITBC|nr:unnamed protein product [Vitrella brassicaformis CCMP3155]|eukprot:CEM32283.1 unnamed protein product [Vitrella brassicaformis CCMP3155]